MTSPPVPLKHNHPFSVTSPAPPPSAPLFLPKMKISKSKKKTTSQDIKWIEHICTHSHTNSGMKIGTQQTKSMKQSLLFSLKSPLRFCALLPQKIGRGEDKKKKKEIVRTQLSSVLWHPKETLYKSLKYREKYVSLDRSVWPGGSSSSVHSRLPIGPFLHFTSPPRVGYFLQKRS